MFKICPEFVARRTTRAQLVLLVGGRGELVSTRGVLVDRSATLVVSDVAEVVRSSPRWRPEPPRVCSELWRVVSRVCSRFLFTRIPHAERAELNAESSEQGPEFPPSSLRSVYE